MSRHRYAGLIIGGPMAGQSIVYHTSVLAVEQMPPTPLRRGGTTPNHVVAERYNWIEIAGMGLWVLEGTTPAEAMNELGMAYMETRNGKR